MKTLRGLLILWICLPLLALQAARFPQLLRLRGRFTDSKVPVTDNLPVRFSIWDSEDGYGNLLWEDIQNVSVQSDTFQVVLGRVKPLTPSVFSGGDRWVELQLGSDAPMRPRHKIPNQDLQAQVAAVQALPPPVTVPPTTQPPPPATVPAMSEQERRELELQIEKYREPAAAREPAREPVRPVKRRHIVPPVQGDGSLGPTYEVQQGDTLKSIAQKLYGNAELWYDLYYLNRDRLGPMGHLFPGQLLILPAQTPGERAK